MSQETIHATERAAGQVKTMSTYDPDSDQLHEECGIFCVWAPDRDVARLTYFGLRALQHRGQESAGIAMGDGGTVMVRKDLGLLDRVFSNADLSTLSGQLAVGHVRYGTAGAKSWEASQPHLSTINSVIIAFTVVELLVDVMLQGIGPFLLRPAIQLGILVALSATVDPTLRQERELQRRLQEMLDRDAAAEGMLGRSPGK